MLTYRSNRIKALRFCKSVLGRSRKYDQAVFSNDRLCELVDQCTLSCSAQDTVHVLSIVLIDINLH